jgi:hypothetical protein
MIRIIEGKYNGETGIITEINNDIKNEHGNINQKINVKLDRT